VPERKKKRSPNVVPAALRHFIREGTDWTAVRQTLQDMAFGLYEFRQTATGEERVYRRPPDGKALQLLTELGWGRPGLMAEDADQAGTRAVIFVVPAQDLSRLEREKKRAIAELKA
jgi:hypothetical protein